jgi:hypothetical protein
VFEAVPRLSLAGWRKNGQEEGGRREGESGREEEEEEGKLRDT